MSYGEELVIDSKTDEEIDEDNTANEFDAIDKVDTKKNRVLTRRRVEDILAEKAYKHLYGDPFDECI